LSEPYLKEPSKKERLGGGGGDLWKGVTEGACRREKFGFLRFMEFGERGRTLRAFTLVGRNCNSVLSFGEVLENGGGGGSFKPPKNSHRVHLGTPRGWLQGKESLSYHSLTLTRGGVGGGGCRQAEEDPNTLSIASDEKKENKQGLGVRWRTIGEKGNYTPTTLPYLQF